MKIHQNSNRFKYWGRKILYLVDAYFYTNFVVVKKGMLNILLLVLIYVPSLLFTFSEQYSDIRKTGPELLLCRKCGADVADSHYLFSKHSSGAKKTDIQNLFGRQNVTVQTLVNPFGIKFDIVTAERARCLNVGPSHGADSWFPGYTWKICTCPHCGQHLGWTFESGTKNAREVVKHNLPVFHGLILNNILGENFTDSLIMMPKMYNM